MKLFFFWRKLTNETFSGAHTIGISHCTSFTNRLYNFSGRGDQDPALDSEYAANLKARKCRSINSTTKVEMDPGSFKTFDLSYYQLVLKRRGLFQSDAALLTDSRTASFITQLVGGSLENFFKEFTISMEKMNLIEPKTGTVGEIRKHCAVVNSWFSLFCLWRFKWVYKFFKSLRGLFKLFLCNVYCKVYVVEI